LFFGRDFKMLKGISASSKYFVVKVLPSTFQNSRFNIILNTKVDKRAVVRNKIKRQLRSVFRKVLPRIDNSVDVLVVVMPGAKELDFKKIEFDVKSLFNKLKVL